MPTTTDVITLPDSLRAKIENYAKRNQPEIYLDYNDKLPNECVNMLLAGKKDECYDAIYESYEESLWDEEWYAIKECYEAFKDEFKAMLKALGVPKDERKDIALELIRDEYLFSTSIDADRLIRNTSIHVVLRTDLEYWVGGWRLGADLGYDDMQQILKFFNINPRLLADYFDLPKTGWRDYPWRNGKHVIEPDKLFESMANCPYGGEIVVLVDGNASLMDLAQWDRKSPVMIKAGAMFLLHDYMNGSGGLEFVSVRDVVINAKNVYAFSNDNNNKYGVNAVHGMTESVWCSVIEIKGVKHE